MFLDPPETLEPPDHDRFWALYQPFLLHRGYELRPRYQPEWQPSWLPNKTGRKPKPFLRCEDTYFMIPWTTLDAIRVRDGVKVAIRCTTRIGSPEIPNLMYLNSPEMRADPRNRTVPVLDILILPDRAFIVMPMLIQFHNLPFRHLGEFTEAMGQLLQGIDFMHEHNMVHRDACLLNTMMDPSRVIPKGFHFVHWWTTDGTGQTRISWKERWSVRPIDYYFIDFETSFRLLASSTTTREVFINMGPLGQDKTVPEFKDGSEFYDAFKLDVYQVGNTLRGVASCYENLSFFDPLLSAMTRRNPSQRPSASDAYEMFRSIVDSWSEKQLSKRIWVRGTTPLDQFLIRHFHRNNGIRFLPSYADFEPSD